MLLDQRALAGLGNVYKSEILFVCRINPFATVDRIGEPHLRRLIAAARRLLRINVRTSLAPITTWCPSIS